MVTVLASYKTHCQDSEEEGDYDCRGCNVKACTELTLAEALRIADDHDKWRRLILSLMQAAANPRIKDGQKKNKNVALKTGPFAISCM